MSLRLSLCRRRRRVGLGLDDRFLGELITKYRDIAGGDSAIQFLLVHISQIENINFLITHPNTRNRSVLSPVAAALKRSRNVAEARTALRGASHSHTQSSVYDLSNRLDLVPVTTMSTSNAWKWVWHGVDLRIRSCGSAMELKYLYVNPNLDFSLRGLEAMRR
jgi:hypothetical protein